MTRPSAVASTEHSRPRVHASPPLAWPRGRLSSFSGRRVSAAPGMEEYSLMDSAKTAPGADAIAANGTDQLSAAPATHPTGRQFSLTGGGYRAVVTEVGAGLRELEFLGGNEPRPLVHGFDAHEPAQ